MYGDEAILFIFLALVFTSHFACRFAAALISRKLDWWVMNVVPVSEPNTLHVIFDRGLLGVAHDWYTFVHSWFFKYYFYFSRFKMVYFKFYILQSILFWIENSDRSHYFLIASCIPGPLWILLYQNSQVRMSGHRLVLTSMADYNGQQAYYLFWCNCIKLIASKFLPWIEYYVAFSMGRCEPFDTYPRTYDMLHASGLFSKEQKRYALYLIIGSSE